MLFYLLLQSIRNYFAFSLTLNAFDNCKKQKGCFEELSVVFFCPIFIQSVYKRDLVAWSCDNRTYSSANAQNVHLHICQNDTNRMARLDTWNFCILLSAMPRYVIWCLLGLSIYVMAKICQLLHFLLISKQKLQMTKNRSFRS